MNKKIILILSLVLLISSSVNAYKINSCADDYQSKKSIYENSLVVNMAKIANFPDIYPTENFKAALYYLEKNDPEDVTTANSLINSRISSNELTNEELIYLYWAKAKFSDKITDTITKQTLSDPDNFLDDVADYLLNSDEGDLSSILSGKALSTWEAEKNVDELKTLVVSLLAIYDVAGERATDTDLFLRKKVEMTLDYLFAIQAATTLNGEYNIPGEGFEAKYAYSSKDNAWTNWNQLLLLSEDSFILKDAVEPGIIIAGYCAPEQAREIYNSRKENDLVTDLMLLDETYDKIISKSDGSESFVVLASSQDLKKDIHSPNYLGTMIRFKDVSRKSYINFWSRTGSEVESSSRSFLPLASSLHSDVLLGELGAEACIEPNIYLSPTNSLQKIFHFDNTKNLLLLRYTGANSDKYLLLRLQDSVNIAKVRTRYSKLSQNIPWFYVDSTQDFGDVIISTKEGSLTNKFFSVELLSDVEVETLENKFDNEEDADFSLFMDTYCNLDTGNAAFCDDDDLLEYSWFVYQLEKTTSFQKSLGVLTYDSMSGDDYVLGTNFIKANGVELSPINSNNRKIYTDDDAQEYLYEDADENIKIGVSGGSYLLTLNFQANTLEELKDSYYTVDEEQEQTTPEESSVQTISAIGEKMALVASSFAKELTDYSISCGPVNEILSLTNPSSLNSLVDDACIIQTSLDDVDPKTRLVFFYDSTTTNPADAIAYLASNYYPFSEWNGQTTIQSLDVPQNICSGVDGAVLDWNELYECDDLEGIKVFINPSINLILLSEGAPFSNNFLESTFSYLASWFGVTEHLTGDISTFDKAYFSARTTSEGTKKIQAIQKNNVIELVFENVLLDASIYNSDTYKIGDGKQRVILSSNQGDWTKIIQKIRLSEKGFNNNNFESECGNDEIELGEDCEQGETEPCENNNNYFKTCDENTCQWDSSQCDYCVDKDKDGYLPRGTCDSGDDWYDVNPNYAWSRTGNNCGEGFDFTDNGKDEQGNFNDCKIKEQGAYKYSGCPQCIHPGAFEVCDGVPNSQESIEVNCDSSTESFNCENTVNDDCDYICDFVDYRNGCKNDDDCVGIGHCLLAEKACVQCLSNEDCASNNCLEDHTCEPSTANCDLTTNDPCSGNEPYCFDSNSNSHGDTCVACRSSVDCDSINNELYCTENHICDIREDLICEIKPWLCYDQCNPQTGEGCDYNDGPLA